MMKLVLPLIFALLLVVANAQARDCTPEELSLVAAQAESSDGDLTELDQEEGEVAENELDEADAADTDVIPADGDSAEQEGITINRRNCSDSGCSSNGQAWPWLIMISLVALGFRRLKLMA